MYSRLLYVFFASLIILIGGLSLFVVKTDKNFLSLEDSTSKTVSMNQSANTTLRMLPDPLYVKLVGKEVMVDISINGKNTVESVQFEIGYNPILLKNVVVVPKGLFADALVTLDLNNLRTGRYSFAMKKNNAQFIKQDSLIASVSFIPVSTFSTTIEFLPKTSVIAPGVLGSSLIDTKGTTILFSSQQASVSANIR